MGEQILSGAVAGVNCRGGGWKPVLPDLPGL
jgi:hypothetical protein